MKVLVTGATGFIGKHVIRNLLQYPCVQVVATSRDIKKAMVCDWYDRVEYRPYDLKSSPQNCFSYFGCPNAMIHLAWTCLPNYSELFHFEENLFLDYFFLKTMIEGGLENLLVTGTCFEYGLQHGELSEHLPTIPVTSYGIAKDSLRKFLQQLQNKKFFYLKWVRLFYIYGEGQSKSSLFSQIDDAIKNNKPVFNMSGGEQLRDYLPVELVAEYLVKILLQNKEGGIINCCSGNPISIRKLIETYLMRKGAHIDLNFGHYPYPEYEPMAFWGDSSKMKKILGERK